MIRQVIGAASAALIAVAAHSLAIAQVPDPIGWTIAPSGRDGGEQRVQFSLSYASPEGGDSNWSNTTPLAELQGLEPAQLASAEGTQIRFRMVREAGRFECEGMVRQQRGTGDCRFAPDARFAAALAQRGIAGPTDIQQFRLALAKVGIALVDELERQRYARPDVDDLIRAGIHGVTPDFVREMSGAGYHVETADALIGLRIHRVTPSYVRELAEAGYRPDAETLRRLAVHRVDMDFIRDMAALGYRDLGAAQLVALRIHNVSPDYVRALRSLGYEGLSADQLKRMRIHGVSADFARRAAERAGRRPDPEELVRMRIHRRY